MASAADPVRGVTAEKNVDNDWSMHEVAGRDPGYLRDEDAPFFLTDQCRCPGWVFGLP